MRTVFFIPPLHSLSGGLAAIYQLAAILHELGHEVAVTCPSAATPGFAGLNSGIHRLSWPDVSAGMVLGRKDIWLVPEGWPNAIAPGVNGNAKVLVYVQNWVHLLNTLPGGVQWKRLPVAYLSVSGPVSWFMREVLELESAAVLPPSIADFFFSAKRATSTDASSPKPDEEATDAQNAQKVMAGVRQLKTEGNSLKKPKGPDKTVWANGWDTQTDKTDQMRRCSRKARVAWMPRKNKTLAAQMREIALNVLSRDNMENSIEFVEISGRNREEVATLLSDADIFLSTGFPEGFALPPLEAMACGAVPVGFSGQGGFEYMRNPALPKEDGVPGLYSPPFELESKQWGANGFFVADGDVMNGGLALACAVKKFLVEDPLWESLRNEGLKTAQAYSEKKLRARVASIWPELIKKFQAA